LVVDCWKCRSGTNEKDAQEPNPTATRARRSTGEQIVVPAGVAIDARKP
jgi:hypothetical protein